MGQVFSSLPMFLIRLLLSPLRLLLFFVYRALNLLPAGRILHHEMPEEFTMVLPSGWLGYFKPREEVHYYQYLSFLKMVAESKELQHVVLTIPAMEVSWAEVEELGRMLSRISHEKELIAYSEGGNLKTLYLMTFASRRYCSVHAPFVVQFPAVESFFLKDFLRRFGIEVESYQAGKYKGAAETFNRNSFSSPVRANMTKMVDDLKEVVMDGLSCAVGMDASQLRAFTALLRNRALVEASELKECGFVKEEVAEAKLHDYLFEGGPPEVKPGVTGPFSPGKPMPKDPSVAGSVSAVKPERGMRTTNEKSLAGRDRRARFEAFRLRTMPSIAVVAMQGAITSGRSGDEPASHGINSHAYRSLFRALEDGSEEAVFLHITSPGGSAEASEILYQSIHSLSQRKPVFAILGSIAASGGYYIACAANRIYAARSGVTGSIGVIQIRPNLERLYRDFGVKKQRIGFERTQDIFSEAHSPGSASKSLLNESVASFYDLFLRRVAEGRAKTTKEVHELAQGRIATAAEFRKSGMIDGHEGFLDVFEEYKHAMGYDRDDRFRVNFYPSVKMDLRSLVVGRSPLGFADPLDALFTFYQDYRQFRGSRALYYLPFFSGGD